MLDRPIINNLGSPSAKFCFYLPTPPVMPQNWHHNHLGAVAQLIELNGNHWRKILTIMAKITAPDDNWKHYRDTQLLKQDEQILVGASHLSSLVEWHFIVGGVSQKLLESETREKLFIPLDSEEKLHFDGERILKVPYLDYRQYPNRLIEVTREQIKRRR
ncbi:hypothetical protein EKG38_23810 [Shewanella canadensis]|uniref:Uncharacterized protein n=1 Tax=Shewanella canadensis TaxID=271096 RepID=A0A431WML9_9GAMM|nr:hypothetical protein [Shewanella canadensis]RTR36495.1 hypothetical protein EKG38_23810 [Shewanella canadensis]